MEEKKELVEEIKKERNDDNKKFFIIVFLLLIMISIGYATLSSTLRISGNGEITKIKWDVHFENIKDESYKAQVITPATIKGTTTDIEYSVKLDSPGSYYKFFVDVKNAGTIDAKLANNPTLNGIGYEQDVYTNYVVTYADGSPIKVGDVLNAGESKKLVVLLEIEKNLQESQFPKSEQSLNLSVDLDYIQKDQ